MVAFTDNTMFSEYCIRDVIGQKIRKYRKKNYFGRRKLRRAQRLCKRYVIFM